MAEDRSRNLLVNLLGAGLLIAAGVGGCFALGQPEGTSQTGNKESAKYPVSAAPIQEHHGPIDIRIDGIVVPYREIDLPAEVSGRVAFKAGQARAGNYVTKGTRLLEIDRTDYDLEVQRFSEQMDQASISIQELDQQFDNNKSLIKLAEDDLRLRSQEVRRMRGLSGVGVSQSELERAQQAEIAARNQSQLLENEQRLLTTRRARLESARDLAKSQLRRAKLDLERTVIVMPVDGVVVMDHVEQGDFVQKGAPVLNIEDTSAVEVKCSLEMSDLYWLWRPQKPAPSSQPPSSAPLDDYELPVTPVTVTYQFAGREQRRFTWSGELTRFDGIGLDQTTRTVPCRVVVKRPRDVTVIENGSILPADERLGGPRALVRGMFVSVVVHLRTEVRVVRVPRDALRPGKQIGRVRDGKVDMLKSINVVQELKERNGDGQWESYWLIEADHTLLQPGDLVVTSSLVGLQPGDSVRVLDTEPIAGASSEPPRS